MKELVIQLIFTILYERGVDREELLPSELQAITDLCDLIETVCDTAVSNRLAASMNALADADLPFEIQWFKEQFIQGPIFKEIIDRNGIPFMDFDLEDHYDGEIDM